MIQKHLRSINSVWMMFTIILMITTETEKERFDEEYLMIPLLIL